MNEEFEHLELKRYLGDGVYAGFDGYQIIIWTERHAGTDWIALESPVMAALNHYNTDLIEKVAALRAAHLSQEPKTET